MISVLKIRSKRYCVSKERTFCIVLIFFIFFFFCLFFKRPTERHMQHVPVCVGELLKHNVWRIVTKNNLIILEFSIDLIMTLCWPIMDIAVHGQKAFKAILKREERKCKIKSKFLLQTSFAENFLNFSETFLILYHWHLFLTFILNVQS